jgi:hypothetical protein
MKSFKSKRKAIVLLAVLTALIAAAVGAYAYFTSSGSGTGSATVGSSSTWTVGQTGVTSGGPLLPDAAIGTGNIQTNAYHVQNTGSGAQYLTNVAIKVAKSDGSAWTFCPGDATDTAGTCGGGTNPAGLAANGKPSCKATDFSVGGQAVGATWTDTGLQGTFAANQNKTTGSVTVQMIDNHANQDNCQGVTVPLYFLAS